MIDILATDVTCGNITIDGMIPKFVSAVVLVFQIAIPILLIILGMLDLGKAVTSNDEKQMKEAQKLLIKRIVFAVLIFFVVALVKFVFGMLSNAGDKTNATSCIDCFISGRCK